MPKIDALYAWIATEADGGEGLPAAQMMLDGYPVMMPLVGADRARVESLRPHAEAIRRQSGAAIRLVRFAGKIETLDTLP